MEVRAWRARAQAVPDLALREDALAALAGKRPHLDGATLFASLAPRSDRRLLRALFCYEAALEYLDNANERGAEAGVRNGRQLHLALIDAIDVRRRLAGHYRHHRWRDDAGLIVALVMACREACSALVSYATVAPLLREEARMAADVLALNHDPSPRRRDQRLRAWAAQHAQIMPGQVWFEHTAAVTGSLSVHALIALSASAAATKSQAIRTLMVYRRLSVVATMLDSYADEARDRQEQGHSYIAHYGCLQRSTARIARLLRDAHLATADLRQPRNHAVIRASMVALYLSSQNARAPSRRQHTATMLAASGPLTRVVTPALLIWRIASGLTEA